MEDLNKIQSHKIIDKIPKIQWKTTCPTKNQETFNWNEKKQESLTPG